MELGRWGDIKGQKYRLKGERSLHIKGTTRKGATARQRPGGLMAKCASANKRCTGGAIRGGTQISFWEIHSVTARDNHFPTRRNAKVLTKGISSKRMIGIKKQ